MQGAACPRRSEGLHVIAGEETSFLAHDTLAPAVRVAPCDEEEGAGLEGELVVLLLRVGVEGHHCQGRERGAMEPGKATAGDRSCQEGGDGDMSIGIGGRPSPGESWDLGTAVVGRGSTTAKRWGGQGTHCTFLQVAVGGPGGVLSGGRWRWGQILKVRQSQWWRFEVIGRCNTPGINGG